MKTKNILFLTIIFVIMLLSIGFSNWRNEKRLIKVDEIIFESGMPKFLNHELINNILNSELDNVSKSQETINLKTLELLFESNPFIYNAELYYNPSGSMGIRIKEQVPELIIVSDTIFYINNEGDRIPVSDNYKPVLPSFLGDLNKNKVKELLQLVNNFKKDDFLKNQLNSIRYESNSYYIKLNSFDFEVEFGTLKNIEDKIQKLKVFSAYYNSMKTKLDYKKISLKYNKQIVAS